MSKLTQLFIVAAIASVIGGAVFLMVWDIPAPAENVSKTISNDRFPS